MAAAYLFSGLDHRLADDVRAAVYKSTGLQILTGSGEWLWRPVSNRETLQISAFSDLNPRGFGLLQRSRSFDAFYDDDTHWEFKPSLWIEPIGDWGEGDLRLLEIPAAAETNENVIAQWRPKAGMAAATSLIDRLPAVLVLVAAFEAPARVLRVVAERQDRQPPALCGRDGGRPVRRPCESRGGKRGRSRGSGQNRVRSPFSQQGQAFGAGRFRS